MAATARPQLRRRVLADDGFVIMGRAFELEGDRLLLRAADKTQEAAPALAHQLSAAAAYGCAHYCDVAPHRKCLEIGT